MSKTWSEKNKTTEATNVKGDNQGNDYIGRYEGASATVLADRIEAIVQETGQTGFHFVDEAAPPKSLKALATELIARNAGISWWGNIRFEKTFTPELCERPIVRAAGPGDDRTAGALAWPWRRRAQPGRNRGGARHADLQRLSLLRRFLRRVSGHDAAAGVRQGRSELPGQPVPPFVDIAAEPARQRRRAPLDRAEEAVIAGALGGQVAAHAGAAAGGELLVRDQRARRQLEAGAQAQLPVAEQVLRVGVSAGHVTLAVIAVLFSLIGAFYYLRVVKVVYFDEPAADAAPMSATCGQRGVLSVNGLLILVLGLLPGGLMALCVQRQRAAGARHFQIGRHPVGRANAAIAVLQRPARHFRRPAQLAQHHQPAARHRGLAQEGAIGARQQGGAGHLVQAVDAGEPGQPERRNEGILRPLLLRRAGPHRRPPLRLPGQRRQRWRRRGAPGGAHLHRLAPAGRDSAADRQPGRTDAATSSGALWRTMVSSSPTVKPKLPSPITETHLAFGRPTQAPSAADIEKPNAPWARLVMKWRPGRDRS